MKVQTPALTASEISVYGPVVASTCTEDIKTYRLVPKTPEEIKSKFLSTVRSFNICRFLQLDRRRRSPNALAFMYSVGKRAIMFDIDH